MATTYDPTIVAKLNAARNTTATTGGSAYAGNLANYDTYAASLNGSTAPVTPATAYKNVNIGAYDNSPDTVLNSSLNRAALGASDTPNQATIYQQKLAQYQAEIDAVNSLYAGKLQQQQQQSLGNLGSGRAIEARSGTLGSDFATSQNAAITTQNNASEDLVRQEQGAKIAAILGFARQDAAAEFENRRAAQQSSTKDYLDYLGQKTTRQTTNAQKVAQSLLDQKVDTSQVDPTQLASIANQYGISTNDIVTQYNTLKQAQDAAARVQSYDEAKNNLSYDSTTGRYISTKTRDPVSVGSGSTLVDPATGKVIYQGASEPKVLSVSEAKALGVPYGTTEAQAASRGIIPGSTDNSVPGYTDQFAATIANASATGTTQNQRESIAANLKQFIANGDYKSANTAITQSVYNALQGTAQTDFTNKNNALQVTADLKKSLQSLADSGYDTSKLTGAADKIQTKLGVLSTDPNFAAVATQANLAFQNYRQQMTGAAFGPQESAEYASVLPSGSNTLSLNLAKIEGLNSYLNSVTNAYIKQTVGDGGVYIKEYAQGAKPQASAQNASEPNADELKQLRSMFPGYSDAQLIKEATGGGSGKVSVGNTSASVNIPQTSRLAYVNNNPGNLRYAGQSGAVPGIGGFAKFASAAHGFSALVNQVALDSGRGFNLSQFISKFAPPSENNTQQYIQQLATTLGISPNQSINTVNPVALAKAIATKESSTTLT